MSFRAKVFSKTFTGAGTVRFPGGKFFRLITASSALNLTFYTPAGMVIAEVSGVLAGFRLRADSLGIDGFGSVDVTTAAAQTVSAIVSSVDIDYDPVLGIEIATPAAFDSLADDPVAATATELIAAADSDRKTLIVTNLAANTSTFRIGDSGAGAANGVPLAPGETIFLDTSAAVYAYNPGAGALSLAVSSIKT